MTSSGPLTAGAVVRQARIAAGLKQEDLGRLCRYSAGSISRMERGLQPMRDVQLLRRVASVLHIPAEQLGLAPDPRHAETDIGVSGAVTVGPRVAGTGYMAWDGGAWVDRRQVLAASLAALGAPLAGRLATTTAPGGGLADRLLRIPRPGVAEPPTAADVAQLLAAVRRGYEAAEFAELAGGLLPKTLDAAEASAAAGDGDDGPARLVLLSRTYATTASISIKLGRLDLAWIAADRAQLAAGRADDPLALAEAARQVSILSRKAGRPDETVTVAVEAADRLHRAGLPTADHVATYGLLLLSAGYAAAAAGDGARSDDLYGAAAGAANRLGEGVWHGDFGTTNVVLHQISAKWVLGDAGTAIAHARTIDAAQLPTAERAQRYWVDVARAWRRWGKPVDAFRALLAAERVAPRAVRVRPVVHSLAAWLLSEPSTIGLAGVRDFAGRVGAT